jgi:transposase
MKRFIGVDLHKTQFTVCILSEDATAKPVYHKYRLHGLPSFCETLQATDEVALEATTNSNYFRDTIAGKVAAVRICDPQRFKLITASTKKTDPHDAYQLALILSKGLYPEVRVRDEPSNRMKELATTRDLLVKQRSELKNSIHNLLSGLGIADQSKHLSSEKALEWVLSLSVDPIRTIELQTMVGQIRSLNAGIASLDDEISRPANQLPGHENVSSINGIGNLSATILLSVIGDVRDFASCKQFCAYFGVVPSVRISNETKVYGRITKRGNRLARKALIQCTWVAIRFNDRLRAFYERLKQKKGTGKAIVATGRKLLELIYFTLTNQIVWEDCNAGTIKT